jgi:hypothetical protein
MLAIHNIPHVGLARRRLSIPNPVLYYNLCQEISTNWQMLHSHTQASLLSKSKPTVAPSNSTGRSILRENDFNALPNIRSRIRANSRYVLRTDISKFYHSIYTHSIPWAIHGKAYAKANRRVANLGNTLVPCQLLFDRLM